MEISNQIKTTTILKHTFVNAYTRTSYKHTSNAYKLTYTRAYIHSYIDTQTQTDIYMYVYIHTYIHTCIIRTYMYT